jgi:hypothetical protein
MVIFRGERLPGDRRTARPSVQAPALRDRCGPVPPACRQRGRGPAAASATGGLPPIGRGQTAAPETPLALPDPGGSWREPRAASRMPAANRAPARNG